MIVNILLISQWRIKPLTYMIPKYKLERFCFMGRFIEFVETPVFTKLLSEILKDDEYRVLQGYLSGKPEAGNIIKESGGLRKLRWAAKGKGKSGGSRVIYYWVTDKEKILMVFIYSKNKTEDLSSEQTKILKNQVEKYLLQIG